MTKLTSVFLALACTPIVFGVEVTNLNDSGSGSLRRIISEAPTGAQVTFSPSLSGGIITLTTGQITIERPLVIDASGLDEGITVTANQSSRLFEITEAVGGPGVTLDSLTLTFGKTEDGADNPDAQGGDGGDGGAIRNAGILEIRNSIFSNNRTGRGGEGAGDDVGGAGSGGNGGAIFSEGALVVVKTKFLNNRAGDGGIGIGEDGVGDDGGDGGAIYSRGEMTIEGSVFSGNLAGTSGSSETESIGDGGDGGAIFNNGLATISSSTISDNFAGGVSFFVDEELVEEGGGEGGGICHVGSSILTVQKSTLTGNTVGSDKDFGGRGGAVATFGPIILEHCTIVGNWVQGSGGGIFAFDESPMLINCIVAHNLVAGAEENFSTPFGGVALDGLNIISEFANSNIESGDSALLIESPRLAPLANYGGFTLTMPPAPVSPAIDRAVSSTSMSDQRGFPIFATPDIGAAEYQGETDIIRFFPVDFDRDGLAYGLEQALGSDPFVADPTSPAVPVLERISDDAVSFSFGINADALPGTNWIVKRSTRLDGFEEIYRFDGVSDNSANGVQVDRSQNAISITDTLSQLRRAAYYQFEARINP